MPQTSHAVRVSPSLSHALAVPPPTTCRDPTPVECKYTGLLFVSKKALEYAAKHGK